MSRINKALWPRIGDGDGDTTVLVRVETRARDAGTSRRLLIARGRKLFIRVRTAK